jgi:hypothetical protein
MQGSENGVRVVSSQLKGLSAADLGERGILLVMDERWGLDPNRVPRWTISRAFGEEVIVTVCFRCLAARSGHHDVLVHMYRDHLKGAALARSRDYGDVELEEAYGVTDFIHFFVDGADLAEAHTEVLAIESQLHRAASMEHRLP